MNISTQDQSNLIIINSFTFFHIMDSYPLWWNILSAFLSCVGLDENKIAHKDLLIQALTHKSYAADFSEHIDHNERLEFAWDGILWSIITTLLFIHHPEKEESDMTLYKIALVREEMLAEVARDICIDTVVLISKWEEKTKGRDKDAILSDTLEAFIWYIAIDIWYGAAYTFVERFIFSKMHTISTKNVKSYKTQIQEWSQQKYKQIPVYEDVVSQEEDNGNVLSYVSNISINNSIIASWYGVSKKKAQEDAAMHAINLLKSWQA